TPGTVVRLTVPKEMMAVQPTARGASGVPGEEDQRFGDLQQSRPVVRDGYLPEYWPMANSSAVKPASSWQPAPVRSYNPTPVQLGPPIYDPNPVETSRPLPTTVSPVGFPR